MTDTAQATPVDAANESEITGVLSSTDQSPTLMDRLNDAINSAVFNIDQMDDGELKTRMMAHLDSLLTMQLKLVEEGKL